MQTSNGATARTDSDLATKAREVGQRYFYSPEERAERLSIMAARELKRENIGVRREGYEFTIDPEAISAFIEGYRQTMEETKLSARFGSITVNNPDYTPPRDATAEAARRLARTSFEQRNRMRDLARNESRSLSRSSLDITAERVSEQHVLSAIGKRGRSEYAMPTAPLMTIERIGHANDLDESALVALGRDF